MALRIPGIAVEGSDRRGSARYFISPAYPRASHSGIRLSSVNFSTRTTPQRSKPSDFASSTTRKVSVRGLIKEIVPYRREPSEPQTGGPPEGSAKPCSALLEHANRRRIPMLRDNRPGVLSQNSEQRCSRL